VNDHYKENYKPLKKEVEDYRRWNYLPCSWIDRIIIVKMATLPWELFSAIPIKIPMTFIIVFGKSTLSSFGNTKDCK
jgi:hypothetical protein